MAQNTEAYVVGSTEVYNDVIDRRLNTAKVKRSAHRIGQNRVVTELCITVITPDKTTETLSSPQRHVCSAVARGVLKGGMYRSPILVADLCMLDKISNYFQTGK